jgi:hypothetical protein
MSHASTRKHKKALTRASTKKTRSPNFSAAMGRPKGAALPPALESYLLLSGTNKRRFLVSFIHNMSISVREYYRADPEAAVEKFRKWNELLHRIAGNLGAMLRGSKERYPDDVLVEMITRAAEDGLQREVMWAWKKSDERLMHRQKRARAPASN